jgi:hypothetical protein
MRRCQTRHAAAAHHRSSPSCAARGWASSTSGGAAARAPPAFSDVAAAAQRLGATNDIHRTPLLESIALNQMTGGRILVKAEALQIAGSFKIRGALNRVLCLSHAERAHGVVVRRSWNDFIAPSLRSFAYSEH